MGRDTPSMGPRRTSGGFDVAGPLTGAKVLPFPVPIARSFRGTPMSNLDKIDHIVVLMLENRSLDALLGCGAAHPDFGDAGLGRRHRGQGSVESRPAGPVARGEGALRDAA